MKAKIALLLLSVGLLVSLTSEIESQATEDYSVEYVTSVSPDLKYAILRITDFDDRGVVFDAVATVLGWRLVEVLDINKGQFKTIREFPGEYEAIQFYDTNAVIICTCTDPNDYLSHKRLMLYEFLKADSMIVLFDESATDSSTTWFDDWSCSEFAYRDSLLAYTTVYTDTASTAFGIDFSVIIRRFTVDGAFPIVKVIPHALGPCFSYDGAQILSTCLNTTDTSFTIAAYDLAQDSITHYLTSKDVLRAQRVTAGSPIYYLSSQPWWSGHNIRRFDPLAGTDTALTHTLSGVRWFSLTGDSLVYEIFTSNEGKTESHIRTMRLK